MADAYSALVAYAKSPKASTDLSSLESYSQIWCMENQAASCC
jgi:hypothetical protein